MSVYLSLGQNAIKLPHKVYMLACKNLIIMPYEHVLKAYSSANIIILPIPHTGL